MQTPVTTKKVPPSAFRMLLGRSFEELVKKGLGQTVARNLRWGEGPAWLADQERWLFSDIPNNRIMEWSAISGLATYRQPAHYANGNFICANGDLLTCEQELRRVIRSNADGTSWVVCDQYRERKLNSPNDVVEKSDGTIWFTDPTYGIISDLEGRKAPAEQEHCGVYRFDPRTGQVISQITELEMPNGLCFSPAEDILFVADSGADMGPHVTFNPDGPRDVYAFPMKHGLVSGPARLVRRVTAGVPDGIRCDADGFLWVSTGNGIDCVAPAGNLLGSIHAAETVSNLAFGGSTSSQLFVTLATSALLIDIGNTQ